MPDADNNLDNDMFLDIVSEKDGTASVRALTLKDGMNYEDARYDDIAAAQV